MLLRDDNHTTKEAVHVTHFGGVWRRQQKFRMAAACEQTDEVCVMQFVVRYWSAHLPDEHREVDGTPRLVDYSTHPPSKLGLHNALLSLHDRIEILEAHGGRYECKVFVVDGDSVQMLTPEMATELFYRLPDGEVKWTYIRQFLLPLERHSPHPVAEEPPSHERQLQLFEYTHVPGDDVVASHHLDIDV